MAGKLKPARAKAGTVALPNKEALLDCFAIASTTEAAKYMVEQFKSRFSEDLKKGNPEDNVFMRVLQTLVDFSKNVGLQRDSRKNPWLGDPNVKTDFQNLQKNITDTNIKSLQDKGIDDINVYFTVRNGELSYAFKPPASDSEMTKLSLASLAEEGMVSKNGVIYNADDHGQILKDGTGNLMKASEDKIRQNISENLPKSLESKGIKANVEFITPKEETKVVAKPVAPVAPQEPLKPVEVVKPEPAPTPTEVEAPRGGIGGRG